MLSILIPIYNYNAYPLVLELHQQCVECDVNFEILCQDDASTDFIIENQKISTLTNTHYHNNAYNQGRGININLLASKAQFEHLLIMDCDTYPKDPNFIRNYLEIIQQEKPDLVFGGIEYQTNKPQKEQLLRYVYGIKRESVPISQRKNNGYKNALTSNLLIRRSVFSKYPFDNSITTYGYEDLCFLAVLKSKGIKIQHIDNPTYHLNLETSSQFLNKTKIALNNLALLVAANKITEENSRLVSTYEMVQKIRLTALLSFLFKKSENSIGRNLLSEKPSIFLFDLFKLGYFCTIRNN
ncbi:MULTISPECIES: glycosyltransferase family 2 protein [unclassified Flavobacterium]|uniref:glycosyltransferase family 2 protein n=1 Tax=unclassified Flavobacterium TaxID=196869 RepID=UPI003F8DF897